MNSKRLQLLISITTAMTIVTSTLLFDIASGQMSPLIASSRGLFNPQTGKMSEERNQEFLNASTIVGLDNSNNNDSEKKHKQ